MKCTIQLLENAFNSTPLLKRRLMHILRGLMNNKGNIRMSDTEVEKTSNNATIESRVVKKI